MKPMISNTMMKTTMSATLPFCSRFMHLCSYSGNQEC
jgi:hypothetical protein